MLNKYLEKEVGTRTEITSSMVARAERAKNKDELGKYDAVLGDYLKAYAQQQLRYGASQLGIGLGSLIGPSGLGEILGISPAKCPYCGK